MYNPEPQLYELLQNDMNHIHIETEGNGLGRELPRRLSLGSLDQDTAYNPIMYQQRNFRTGGTFYDDNGPNGIDIRYNYNPDAGYQDSINELTKASLEGLNVFQNTNNQLGQQDSYTKEETFGTQYQNQSGYEPSIFDKIHYKEYGSVVGKTVENDTSLPIANIGRLMKSVLPNSAKIAKQAKDMIRDCVTEFIFFISSEASDLCSMERRKTLNADDIFIAMNKLGFEHYDRPLKLYHSKWRETKEQNMPQNNPRTQ